MLRRAARASLTVDQRDLRRIFATFATGVTVVTAYDRGGEPIAITANSFSSVSLDPPLLLWCLDNRSRHLAAFAKGNPFAVHILSEGQEDTAMQFARSGASGLPGKSPAALDTAPSIAGALARIACRVSGLYPAGDHMVIFGEIDRAEFTDRAPLVFQGSAFGRFVPGGPPGGQEAWRILVDMWS